MIIIFIHLTLVLLRVRLLKIDLAEAIIASGAALVGPAPCLHGGNCHISRLESPSYAWNYVWNFWLCDYDFCRSHSNLAAQLK